MINNKHNKIDMWWVGVGAIVLFLLGLVIYKHVMETTIITPQYRTESCRVISSRNGITTVVDNSGEVWTYYGEAKVGRRFRITFDTQRTATITDDAIVKIN